MRDKLEAAWEGEEWRPTPIFGDVYEVSNFGRVRNRSGLVLKGSVPRHSREYIAVGLNKQGDKRRMAVHRMVCIAFHGEPTPGQVVRHIDGNHLNNKADNLAWGTAQENANDRAVHGTVARGERHGRYGATNLRGERNGNAKLDAEAVLNIRNLAGKHTQRELAAMFGVHQCIIQRVIHRKAWAHV